MVNLFADLKIQSWIETPNTNLSPLGSVHVDPAKIAHVRDLSLVGNQTQDLAQDKEKMQLEIVQASAQRNLIVKIIAFQFYRVAWWVTIALFISFFLSVSIGRNLA